MPAGDAAEGLAGVDFNSSSLTMETRLKGGKALWSGKIASDSESEFRLRFRSISGLLLKSNGVVDVNSEDPLFRRSLELSRLSEDLDTGTGTFSNLGRLAIVKAEFAKAFSRILRCIQSIIKLISYSSF